jgi:23S rRNA pseudouridine2605 synthase/16S rRNA pseudouridine516 synthase
VRRQFGPLHLGTLAQGELRDLSKAELGQILTIARTAKEHGAHAAVNAVGADEQEE